MSCNNVNRELPFGLDVAAGKIPGVNALYKIGRASCRERV